MGKTRSAKTTNAAPAAGGFIFRGTVQRVKDSTVPDIRPDANTSVVRVDEVIAAPSALAHVAGREVTIITGGGTTMKPGQQAVFRAGSMSFGRELAVRVMSAEPLTAGAPAGGMAAARAAAAPLAAEHALSPDPVQAHRDLQLKRSLDDADVVVAGTVTAVRMSPETTAIATAAAAPMSAAAPRISEHDPLWHEAVINVESVEKGSTRQKQVVVRFPGSNDVRWRNHPKFKPGQQGVFLLTASPGPRFTATPVPSTQRGPMVAMVEPQPISAITRLRQLLRTSGGSSSATRKGAQGRRRASSKK